MKLLDYLRKPAVAAALGAVVGLIVGLIWAWGIQPVVWKDVPPAQMGTTYQEDYLRMASDSYSVHPDNALALQRYQALGTAGPATLAAVKLNPGNSGSKCNLGLCKSRPAGRGRTDTDGDKRTTPGKTSSFTSIAIILGAVILVCPGGIWNFAIPDPAFPEHKQR